MDNNKATDTMNHTRNAHLLANDILAFLLSPEDEVGPHNCEGIARLLLTRLPQYYPDTPADSAPPLSKNKPAKKENKP